MRTAKTERLTCTHSRARTPAARAGRDHRRRTGELLRTAELAEVRRVSVVALASSMRPFIRSPGRRSAPQAVSDLTSFDLDPTRRTRAGGSAVEVRNRCIAGSVASHGRTETPTHLSEISMTLRKHWMGHREWRPTRQCHSPPPTGAGEYAMWADPGGFV